jgi:hypothetical protein
MFSSVLMLKPLIVLFQTLMAGFSESGWDHVASKLSVSLCCCWAGTFGSQALSFINHLVPDCLLCSVLTGLLFTWVDIAQQLQDYIYPQSSTKASYMRHVLGVDFI